jgi:hypothetical protein
MPGIPAGHRSEEECCFSASNSNWLVVHGRTLIRKSERASTLCWMPPRRRTTPNRSQTVASSRSTVMSSTLCTTRPVRRPSPEPGHRAGCHMWDRSSSMASSAGRGRPCACQVRPPASLPVCLPTLDHAGSTVTSAAVRSALLTKTGRRHSAVPDPTPGSLLLNPEIQRRRLTGGNERDRVLLASGLRSARRSGRPWRARRSQATSIDVARVAGMLVSFCIFISV